MRTIPVIAAVITITLASTPYADTVRAAATVSQSSVSAGQQRWLDATFAERLKIAEDIGEEGARQWARRMGYEPILQPGQKTYRHGFDQVYRAPNGEIVVVEAKGGTSPLNRGYGHVQGTPEHAVESAKRILRSSRATAAEKHAARTILEAAGKGQLRTVVVRTPHVLGKPSAPVLEKAYTSTDAARSMANAALKETGHTGGSGAPSATATKQPKTGNGSSAPRKSPSGTTATESLLRPSAKTGGAVTRMLSVAGRTLVVAGVVFEGAHRIKEGRAIEGAYARGEYSQEERIVQHAGNVGGCAVGFAGAAVGVKAGGVTGAAIGSIAGPVGTAVGGFFGALSGGIVGYFGGSWAGEHAAEASAHALVS